MSIKKARTPKVYRVVTPDGTRLVRAVSPQQAIKHVVLGAYMARLATQDDLISLAQTHRVEDAGADEGDE